MVFTRTPRAAHSRARNNERLTNAALAAEYATTRDSGTRAATLAMFMMLPFPRAAIAGPNSRHGNKIPPTRFRSKFARQASSDMASNE